MSGGDAPSTSTSTRHLPVYSHPAANGGVGKVWLDTLPPLVYRAGSPPLGRRFRADQPRSSSHRSCSSTSITNSSSSPSLLSSSSSSSSSSATAASSGRRRRREEDGDESVRPGKSFSDCRKASAQPVKMDLSRSIVTCKNRLVDVRRSRDGPVKKCELL